MKVPRKLRVVVAGQTPPPTGGQNVMIAQLLEELRADESLRVEHLAFHFTPSFKTVRAAGVRKLLEVVKVMGRLLRLRLGGPIDILIFPPGGPQNVPLFRDLLLLPWILLFSRKVVLHFHAAGIADRLEKPGLLPRMVSRLYRRCQAAVVMTDFNRRDPEACGIQEIHVIPHRLKDEFDPVLVDRDGGEIRLLYMGHLCPDKGTPVLLEAFASITQVHPEVMLELAGETLPPYSTGQMAADLLRLGISDRVRLLGVVKGEAKRKTFGRAHLFLFPSVAPYESFGLVMVEAMMWGLPIIASDWRGNRDVLGDEATLVAPNITQPLTNSIERWLSQPRNRNVAGASNRNRFANSFDLRSESELRKIIEEVATSTSWLYSTHA